MKWLKSLFFGTLIFAVANLFTPALTAKQATTTTSHDTIYCEEFIVGASTICIIAGWCHASLINDFEVGADGADYLLFVESSIQGWYCVYRCYTPPF